MRVSNKRVNQLWQVSWSRSRDRANVPEEEWLWVLARTATSAVHKASAFLIGFAQLPAAIVTQRPWREVLQFHPQTKVDADMIQNAYRALAERRHPDKPGGSHESMTELNAARAAAIAEVGA